MDELSFEIGKNIRKYRKLKGLTLEKLAEVLETETNYLGSVHIRASTMRAKKTKAKKITSSLS